MDTFRKELETLINMHSLENGSDTPDFILAQFLVASLEAFDAATKRRSEWYGHAAWADKGVGVEVPTQEE